MKTNGERAFALLGKIGFERISGSEEELRAAHILLDELDDIGLRGELESFTVPDGKVLEARMTVTAPFTKEYEVTGYKCAGNTPAGGLVADICYIGDVSDISLVGMEGKVILINGRMSAVNYAKVVKAGCAGFITMAGSILDTPDTIDLDTRKLRPTLAQYGLLPAFNMRMADALEMVQNGASRVKLELATEDETLTSHNVIAEIPGTRYPDEIVVLGAHFDSVQFSTGVYDNGAGSVMIMEMLRHFAANPPARTLRFVWFGSEEQGLLGSKAYLAAHEDDIPKMRLMINLDVGAILFGSNMAGVSADKGIVTYLEYLAKEMGYPTSVRFDIMSSDSSSFVDKGVPAVSFGRGGTRGSEYMHTRYDRMEYQAAFTLAEEADYAGTFVERMVNAAVFPVPRTIPDEIVKKTDEYFNKKKPE